MSKDSARRNSLTDGRRHFANGDDPDRRCGGLRASRRVQSQTYPRWLRADTENPDAPPPLSLPSARSIDAAVSASNDSSTSVTLGRQ
jgi:hypothetical protein